MARHIAGKCVKFSSFESIAVLCGGNIGCWDMTSETSPFIDSSSWMGVI